MAQSPSSSSSSCDNHKKMSHDRVVTVKALPKPAPMAELANVAFFGFAVCTLSLASIKCGWVDAKDTVIFGPAMSIGSFAQLFAGIFDTIRGRTHSANIWLTFGLFWIGQALLYWPGLLPGEDVIGNTHYVLGYYCMGWACQGFVFMLASINTSNWLTTILFLCLTCANACLSAAEFTQTGPVLKAGGYFLLICAIIAFYLGTSEYLEQTNGLIKLPRFSNVKHKKEDHIV